MAKNLVLSEAEFDEFKQYCHEKGFDLSYFGPDISGSKEEIERYQFDGPKVIKVKRRRFSFRVSLSLDVQQLSILCNWGHKYSNCCLMVLCSCYICFFILRTILICHFFDTKQWGIYGNNGDIFKNASRF